MARMPAENISVRFKMALASILQQAEIQIDTVFNLCLLMYLRRLSILEITTISKILVSWQIVKMRKDKEPVPNCQR